MTTLRPPGPCAPPGQCTGQSAFAGYGPYGPEPVPGQHDYGCAPERVREYKEDESDDDDPLAKLRAKTPPGLLYDPETKTFIPKPRVEDPTVAALRESVKAIQEHLTRPKDDHLQSFMTQLLQIESQRAAAHTAQEAERRREEQARRERELDRRREEQKERREEEARERTRLEAAERDRRALEEKRGLGGAGRGQRGAEDGG